MRSTAGMLTLAALMVAGLGCAESSDSASNDESHSNALSTDPSEDGAGPRESAHGLLLAALVGRVPGADGMPRMVHRIAPFAAPKPGCSIVALPPLPPPPPMLGGMAPPSGAPEAGEPGGDFAEPTAMMPAPLPEMSAPEDIERAVQNLGPGLPSAGGDAPKALVLVQVALLPRLPAPIGPEDAAAPPAALQGAPLFAPPHVLQCTLDDPHSSTIDRAWIAKLVGDAKDGAVSVAIARFPAPPAPELGEEGAPSEGAPIGENCDADHRPPLPVVGHGFFAILPLGPCAAPAEVPNEPASSAVVLGAPRGE